MSLQKKFERELRSTIEEVTRNYQLLQANGGHVRIILHRAGKVRTVFAAGTPSDRRAILNIRAAVRRAWADLGRT